MTIEELVDQELSYKDFESEELKPDLTEEYLAHHGILGMHWGQRNGPPYPLGSDKSTGHRLKTGASGKIEKKKPEKKSFAEKRKAKKVYKKRVQAAQKARETKAARAAEAKAKAAEEERKAKEAQEAQDKAEKEAMEREIWRQDVIKKGDIQSAKEHTDMFSTDEVNQIISKYNADQRLSQLVADSMPKTPAEKTKYEKMQERVDKIQKFAGTVSDIAGAAKKVYDAYETVNTILGAPQKKQQESNKAAAEDRAKKEAEWKNRVIMTRDMATMLANKNRFTSKEISDLLGNVEADEKLANKIGQINKPQGAQQTNQNNVDKSENTNKPENNQPQQQQQKNQQTNNQPQQQQQNQQRELQYMPISNPTQKQTSKSAESSKSSDSPSLMDRLMTRTQNAISEQRSANQQVKRDKSFYRQQSIGALNLMKAELESQRAPMSQIEVINDVIKEKRKKGE